MVPGEDRPKRELAPRTGWFTWGTWTRAHYFTGGRSFKDAHNGSNRAWCDRTWYRKDAEQDHSAPRCERCSIRAFGGRT